MASLESLENDIATVNINVKEALTELRRLREESEKMKREMQIIKDTVLELSSLLRTGNGPIN